jgi:D-amino-acid oxidase
MNSKNVLIVGTGVSGLSVALKLLQAGHNVTLYSKEADGELPKTSKTAYAMWVPVRIDGTNVERWTNETYAEFQALANDPNTGIAMREIVVFKPEHTEPWYSYLDCFRHATADELAGTCYSHAHVYDKAPVITPAVYLAWLRAQDEEAGGVVVQREVQQWSDCPAEFDVIVNCAGLGARKLANDQTLYGERVQVVRIKAKKGIDKVYVDDEGANKRSCVVPHGQDDGAGEHGYIQCGAVFDGEQDSLDVDDTLTAEILARCNKMVPGLEAQLTDVISVERAHRPERAHIRVECDKTPDGRQLIHNYGHDGMGYLTSSGIAAEIVGFLTEAAEPDSQPQTPTEALPATPSQA